MGEPVNERERIAQLERRVAELEAELARTRAESAQRIHELETMLHLAEQINQSLELPTVLNSIMRRQKP
jgi:BMFP domain-containing protein YqiC